MNKNIKILSTLLVSFMGLGLSSTNKVNNVKDDNGPLVVKDILRANAIEGSGATINETDAPTANNLVSNVLAQVNSPVDGKINIRFVAGIDTYTYGAAQFNIAVKDTDGVVAVEKSVTVNHAYLGIEVEGETQYPSTLWGSDYNYLIAYTLTDVPVDYWNYNFEVTASIGTDSENLTATSAEVKTKNITTMIEAVEQKELVLGGTWNPHGNVYLVLGWTSDVVNAIDGVTPSSPTIISYSAIGVVDGVEYPFAVAHNDGEKAKFFTNDAMVAVTGDIANATYTLKLCFMDTNATEWVAEVKVVNGKKVTLADYKTSAVSELEAYPASKNYTEGLYTEENWTTIQSYITEGSTNINNATSYDGVDAALTTAKSNIDSVEQRGLTLDETIANAKTVLESHVSSLTESNYSEENWTIIQELLTAGNTALEACETEEEVNTTLENYKTQINAVQMLPKELVLTGGAWNPHGNVYLVLGWTNDFTNANIQSYSAIGVVDGVEYPFAVAHNDGEKAKFFTNDAMVAVTGDIASATYLLKLSFLVDDGFYYEAEVKVVNGKKLTLADYKTSAVSELEAYPASKNYTESLYTEENWTTIQSYITEGSTNINNATSYDDVDAALTTAKSNIDAVEQRELSLDETKTAAKSTLSSYVGTLTQDDYSEENWATIQTLLTEGTTAIDSCESTEAINTTLEEYKTKIAAIEKEAIELVLGGNWNPHGDGFLVFGWTNSGLTNDNISTYEVTAVIDGVESQFVFDRIDGTTHAFFRNTTLGTGIGSATYTLKVKFITTDGTIYSTTREVVNGQLA